MKPVKKKIEGQQMSKITEDEVASLYEGLLVGTVTIPQATEYINERLASNE